ncbi:hypothetical protein BSKO_10928 [Bryopsis sp. KO-2023]|nr:hypothetical protein BSKO_10928 [Bryopsis sp. KO-2023]
MTVEKAAKKYAEMYTQLLDHGFQKGDIEQSMEALPGGCTAINVAMDWLMLNVSAEELPQKFTNKMHAKGPVQIISLMESDAAPAIAMDCEDSTDKFKSDIDQAKEDEKKRLEEEKRKQDEKKSKGEQDAQRDWILKYMEQECSSQDSGEEGVDPLADYDVWSDPREVERRKQERKKGELPLEVRQKLIAKELVKMKQMAADAKAEKDKARQKEAGSRIPKLKSEMAEIGMTDAMADALML